MKVILNVDVKYLGEEGDVKNVANGYARNFLLPRNLAVPYNNATAAAFEARKAEIEARKEVKRQNSRSLKERLEGNAFEIVMPAGPNGRLYGAVSSHLVSELLAKHGFEIERKRIEIPGLAIKAVGTYRATIKLYESQTAEITLEVKAQDDAAAKAGKAPETKAAPKEAAATETAEEKK